MSEMKEIRIGMVDDRYCALLREIGLLKSKIRGQRKALASKEAENARLKAAAKAMRDVLHWAAAANDERRGEDGMRKACDNLNAVMIAGDAAVRALDAAKAEREAEE